MTYITEAFEGRRPTPPRYTTTRAHAATVAKGILDDDADVYDIVTLAEFLLGEGNGHAQPAPATAPPTPSSVTVETAPPMSNAAPKDFHITVTDGEGERIWLSGFANPRGDYVLVAMVNDSGQVGLTRAEAVDLRDKLNGLLG